MQNLNFQRQLEDYIAYHERITVRSLRLLEKMAAPEMRYIDPFHDVRGIDHVVAVFRNVLERHIERPRFQVSNIAWGRDGYTVFLRWTLHFAPVGRKEEWALEGIAEIVFGPDGKIVQHQNHWDSGSQLMVHMPFYKWVWTMFAKKITA